MAIELIKSQDLFSLKIGDTISKRNLFDLIQHSKIEGSPFWSGEEFAIGNTPQQGINWIGNPPSVKGVIIKTRQGLYKEDGWTDDGNKNFHYSFKARNAKINLNEKANDVLIKQPQYLYPILLFSELNKAWSFEGSFSVSEIEERFVTLQRSNLPTAVALLEQYEELYKEGERRYVTHLMAERNRAVVLAAKSACSWVCEICKIDFQEKYGVNYIEAHHKTPISTYSEKHIITQRDLALLCPNCHKAVHIHMKINDLEYNAIKALLTPKD